MTGPLQAAGAVSEPSEYAPIGMDRAITGLWTQRSPLRDAAVPYLQAKFYSASRFDSLIDGLNREITAKLTTARRPGSSVYNSATWPAINSFFSFKSFVNNIETLKVIVDTASVVYDGTGPSTKTALFNKTTTNPTRFASINNALYFFDGVDAQKYLQPSLIWQANTSFEIGDYILDSNGFIQVVDAITVAAPIAEIQVLAILGVTYVRASFTESTPFSPGLGTLPALTFAGLTSATFLNGQTIGNITTYADDAVQVQPFAHGAYGPVPDTGTATGLTYEVGQSGTTGGTAPGWNASVGGLTNDGAITWKNAGKGVFPLGVISSTVAPTVVPGTLGDNRFWQPSVDNPINYSILDSNGNVEISINTSRNGVQPPKWNPILYGITQDGAGQWLNAGPPGQPWVASFAFPINALILDTNGNYQLTTVVAGNSGATVPTWNATIGGTTTDGGLTWTNIGTGTALATAGLGYAYAYQSLDGSVTNASPTTFIIGGVLGGAAGGYQVQVSGPSPSADSQYTGIVIYRIAQGGSILLELDIIPNLGGGWSYLDTLPDADLNALIEAPIDLQNNPPPAGATAPTIHLQRQWVPVGPTLFYSTGPDTNGGSNGYTAFNPQNFIQFQAGIIRTDSVTLNTGPALVVWTTSYIGIVTGLGTTASPFVPSVFMPKVGLLSYTAVDVVGSTFYLLTNKLKGVSVDPGAGYQEVGFPIGDQFERVTTGGQNAALFAAADAYVTWYEASSGDTGMYFADGAFGWFRYSPVSSPESGFLWSPLAGIVGGTSAVQSVETAIGSDSLLIGPESDGPILKRDTATNADNGTAYSSYITIGNIMLCESGEVAEIAHIGLQSMAIGQPPQVGLLLGEIHSTAEVPFDLLQPTSADPPTLPEAQTLFNDRYVAMQNGVCPKCMHFQLLLNYPTINAADELLAHTIYGAKHSERKQQ